MDRRLLLLGLLGFAIIGAALWFVPVSPLHGMSLAGESNKEVGAAFLGLFLIVGVALGFDMSDWFDR